MVSGGGGVGAPAPALALQVEAALVGGALRREAGGVGGGGARPHAVEQTTLWREFARLCSTLRRPGAVPPPPPDWVAPFLAVVRSERTAAYSTSLALSALHKFLSYGLLDPTHPSTPATVESIADAVTHARFVSTDHSSDGVVLMKILQVLRTLLLSPEGATLTGDSVCEIMLSCFRICFETRLSELLRRNADQCLRDMIQHVFMRLPQFSATINIDSENISRMKCGDQDSKPSEMCSDDEESLRDYATLDKSNNPTENKAEILNDTNDITDMEAGLSNKNEFRISKSESEAGNIDDTPKQNFMRSPIKKHGRHSSMDLASNDNISQLVEKCVFSSDCSEKLIPCDSPVVEEKNEIQPMTTNEENKEKIDSIENKLSIEQTINVSAEKSNDESSENEKDFINPMGVRFIPYNEQTNLQPYGVSCIKELFRFLISLCNPLDGQNNSSMVYLGLCLLQTVLEVSADHLAQYPSLLALIKDSLSRNLLSLLDTERASIFSLDLQVSFLLFESLRTHLKFQMESYFTKLIDIIMSDNTKNSYESKEITHLALESIAQMWRIPGLCTELYLNYDCDVYCTNLFEDITKLLSKSIVASGVNNYYALALDALLSIIESIETNCLQTKLNEKTTLEIESVNYYENSNNKSIQEKHIAIDMEDSDEYCDNNLPNISQFISFGVFGRHKISNNLPTQQQLLDIKNRKRWIATGTELFNQKPEKGIEYLQEHGILSIPLDPLEIANFLKNNPGLDKKMIGEYISKKKNVESRILATYAASFDMTGLRIDQALRLYLETFRLPGEAPLIFLVMEHFAEHWHSCNGHPFANTDAAFRLAYAIIMLNMDQHNHNAKKLNIPMTMEDFVRNLRGCNGHGDFDQKMLEAVFNAIKNEEIVMPAERTGIVKENYLWKVLLRRGVTKEGIYVHCPNGIYDLQLFSVSWGPLVAALSSIFEKTNDTELYTQALDGFEKCASIVGQHLLSNELDTLILSLCKFSGLLSLPEQIHYIHIGTTLGQTIKAQLALKKVFNICHRHGDSIREGWKHMLEVILTLYKGHLLPKSLIEVDDFCSPTGKISLINEPSQQPKIQESGLLSSLYSYIALSSDNNAMRSPSIEESELISIASECVTQCNIDTLLLTDSKFLQLDSLQELVKYLIVAGKSQENQAIVKSSCYEDPTIFFLELLIKVIIQNRDRVSHIWKATESHVTALMKSAAELTHNVLIDKLSYNNTVDRISFSRHSTTLLERSSTGLLRLAINLMRNEECASNVLHSLKSFLDLSYPVYHHIAIQIAVGLFELVKTSAQNIHSAEDWALVFTLLETTGAGAMHLKQDDSLAGSKSDGAISSEEDSVSTDRGYTSEGELSHSPPSQGWILVGNDSEGSQALPNKMQANTSPVMVNPLIHPCALRPHEPHALLKCWECLAFIVRDVAHITPYNFESCVNCIRTFVEASLHGVNQTKVTTSQTSSSKENRRKKQINHAKRMQKSQDNRGVTTKGDGTDADVPEGYQLISIQLLDLMHTLHSRTAQIFKWWREEANFGNPSISQESNVSGTEWCDLWHLAWQPLLQGIARLCTDQRKQVSNSAVTYLQRALLVHDLQTLSGEEWEACFYCVLFPLLSQLSHHHDEIRLRANTIMCKVFLHHLTPLIGRPSFSNLWLSLLDLMRSLMTGSHTTDLLYEATLESLKNMLLVMDSVKVFSDGDNYSELWNITWDKINAFLPKLKEELFRPLEHPKAHSVTNVEHSSQDIENVLPLVVETSLASPTNISISIDSTRTTAPTLNPNVQKVAGKNQTVIQNTIFSPSLNSGNVLNSNMNKPNMPTNMNTQAAKGSIILQPPGSSSQIHSPLFTHLGQMVSTPIGVAVPISSTNVPSYPILCPAPLPNKYFNNQNNAPVLVSSPTNNTMGTTGVNLTANPALTGYATPQIVPVANTVPSSGVQTFSTNYLQSEDMMHKASSNVNTKSAYDFHPELNDEVQQPKSLYGEYLTNPYNPQSGDVNEPVASESSLEQSKIDVFSATLGDSCDFNPSHDVESQSIGNFNTSHLHKSQSATSSPFHQPNQISNSFGSSDNIKLQSRTDNLDNSGIFSFSKYFYSDSTNIPPGSEILFGEPPQ